MDKMKKSVLKGFTLVELLVVMAIFSVLMAAALALTTPVSRMYKNTALAEKTYSYSNNIQEYLQGTLEYADSLYILTEDNLGTYASDMKSLAEDFRKDHYDKVVTSDDGEHVRGIRGKIYILRLLNEAATINGVNVPAGQITLTEYWFDNEEEGNEIQTVIPERTVLNPAFFSAPDSKYSFSYALGNADLVTVPTPAGGDANETYKAVRADRDDVESFTTDSTRLSISIILDKDASAKGYIDTSTYRAFKAPVAAQIANLPLTNINTASRMRAANTGSDNIAQIRPRLDEDGTTVRMQRNTMTPDPECGYGFKIDKANSKIDFNNDIYFVFAYGDELR
ncbi:type II secretion system protein [uncultured Ruminococcus sp.]|uniref:type II secretion system protein n=1 Tax=uncultured Ruminococcus sp. TaxID=165186 RepID=UPI0025D44742|nr:type II secretion system protein [uncultured Ruminococcus sp.]